MFKFIERPKTPGITSKKNMAFPRGNKLFAGDFRANLDETNADMVQFTKRCNWNWKHQGRFCRKFPATNVSSALRYVHLQLVSQVHMMAGQNIKKKYLMCQIPIKMLKQNAIPNSSLYNLKIYSSKGCRKTSQR